MTNPLEYDGNIYLKYVLRKWLKAVFIITAVLVIRLMTIGGEPALPLGKFFLLHQDIVLLPVILVCWMLCSRFSVSIERSIYAAKDTYGHYFRSKNLTVFWTAGILALVCYAGHYFLLGGYANSRDEQMAVFDSQIFVQGLLVSPIDSQWRALAPALNQMFMIPIGQQEAWVSAYLPINAAFRALFATLGDAALTSPFFVAVGAMAIWRVTKQLWPEHRDLPILSLILYAGSGQIIFNGMTSYAMSGHLALNLVWLSLFLMDKKRYDVAALALGFLATGLHQPIFHPLFAAPILTLLVLQKNWSRASIYLAGYAVICAFWLYWPVFISSLATTRSIDSAASVDYLSRLQGAITGLTAYSIFLMLINFTRFLAWQHIILLPLASIGFLSAWKGRHDHRNAFFVAVSVSFALPMIVMLILLPDQGYGWGYRYMHGVIGNGILLAALGWQSLGKIAVKYQTLLISSAATFFLMIPIQAYVMHKLYTPFAQIDERMNNSKADLILVDTDSFIFAQDLVFNLPDFTKRPVRLAALMFQDKDFVKLCAGNNTLSVVGVEHMRDLRIYWQSNDTGNPGLIAAQIVAAQKSGCKIAVL
jgi:hypothetical protein